MAMPTAGELRTAGGAEGVEASPRAFREEAVVTASGARRGAGPREISGDEA
ncbi:hypothetical protein [Streptomyces sp. NPDC056796]|uniref:hypothetical protein n=1 Tax=unclassified Streptomyces TaxID=2593676 RepID=UPI0036C86F94